MDAAQIACKERLSKDTRSCGHQEKENYVSLEVTSEEVHDGKVLKKLVDNASENNDV
jgi:hypothetical protein